MTALIVGVVFGLALPHIASYGAEWRSITAVTLPWALAVAAAAAVCMAASWLVISAALPRVRLREAAAVNLASSAVANTVPGGGAVAVGLSWRMLGSWGIGTPEFVRYTLVTGLWNVFARLGLPVAALSVLAIGGGAAGVPRVAAYCGAGALAVTAIGVRALLRGHRAAAAAARCLQRAAGWASRLARRRPPARLADAVLGFREDTSTLLATRGIRLTAATAAVQGSTWLVLLACLRASGLTQQQVPWQASLAAFAVVRLLTMLPITPGGLGVVELGLAGPLAAGLGAPAAARVAGAVLLFRAATYLPALPLGALSYAWWRHSRRPGCAVQ